MRATSTANRKAEAVTIPMRHFGDVTTSMRITEPMRAIATISPAEANEGRIEGGLFLVPRRYTHTASGEQG